MSRTRGGRNRSAEFGEQRLDLGPQRFIGFGQANRVAGQPGPGALDHDLTGLAQRRERRIEDRTGQSKFERQPERLDRHALPIRMFGVVAGELSHERLRET